VIGGEAGVNFLVPFLVASLGFLSARRLPPVDGRSAGCQAPAGI